MSHEVCLLGLINFDTDLFIDMAQETLIIYYFSGTGNARTVAFWLAQEAASKGIPCTVVNMALSRTPVVAKDIVGKRIVFVSPVHGFNYPPLVLRFIHQFPKGNNQVVLMNTRAGMRIGNFITPGVSGVSFFWSGFVLWLKGYTIQAFGPVDLPSNWVSLHPGLNDSTIAWLHRKNEERVHRFANKIVKGNRVFKALLEVYDILFAPVALLYYFIGRFVLAKTFYATADCNRCGKCRDHCPAKAIRFIDNRPYWSLRCESCMHCMSYCPAGAVHTGHGYLFVFSLMFTVLFRTLIAFLVERWPILPTSGAVVFLIESVVFLFLFTLWYRIIHFLLKFSFFETIIRHTSLTYYRFWGKSYRAPNG